MFTRAYPLFRLFGFEVKIDLTWLLLALLITWSLATGLFPYYLPNMAVGTYWAMGVAGTIGLLLSIVFHELSHSLVARRYGLPIRGITLFIFGGVAEMHDEPASPKAEFLMAVAGPVSSVILAAILYGIYSLGTGIQAPVSVTGVIGYLAFLNLILAIFNVVPAFPLDGGRMLRAALWGWTKDLHRATEIAANFGSGFGIVLIVLGVFNVIGGNFIGGMWWFLIGLFLRGAAHMSFRQMLMREAIEGEPVRRFMNTSPITVPPSTTVEELVEDYMYKYHYKMFPVVENSRLLGYVSNQEVKRVPRDEWSRRQVHDLIRHPSEENSVTPDEDAFHAMRMMTSTGNSRVLVVQDNRLVGILAMKDLMKFLSMKMDLEQPA